MRCRSHERQISTGGGLSMTLRKLAGACLLSLFVLILASPAQARSFTSDMRANVQLFLSEEGWLRDVATAQKFLDVYGTEESYNALLSVFHWEKMRPQEVKFEQVRQVFSLSVLLDMNVMVLKRGNETSTNSAGKRLAQKLLADQLELQSRTVNPEEASIRISTWIGLTPEEYGEAWKRAVEAYMELARSSR